jgi:hypothetical protein
MPGFRENRPERPDRGAAGSCHKDPAGASTPAPRKIAKSGKNLVLRLPHPDRSGPIRFPWRPKAPAAPRSGTSRPRLRSSDCPGVACPALSIRRVDTVGSVMIALNPEHCVTAIGRAERGRGSPPCSHRCMFFVHRPASSIVVTWTHHDGR